MTQTLQPPGNPDRDVDDLPREARALSLSLISHTNAGKTTLARTLLGRDIGEVRDEAHVTFESERQTLLETPEGDRLELWDTPGFGDSERLARRLRMAGNPIGWLLTEVWDRFRDRAFWSSQKAVRTVADETDVVLYLVNASEAPEDVGYLDAELQVLDLLGRPVIALLNQLGPPLSPRAEASETGRWRERLQQASSVREVIALDAFARCWVQEGALFDAVGRVVSPDQRAPFERLRERWWAQRLGTWEASMAVLADAMARAARDREPVVDDDWGTRLSGVASRLGLRRGEKAQAPRPADLALRTLTARLNEDLRRSTDRLIALHGLEGRASEVVLQRLAERVAVTQPLDEKQVGLWGGLITGALTGLKADVLSGGLTLGGGLLAGSVIGALTGLGVARGVNRARGMETAEVAWEPNVLEDLAKAALLIYLAVAHYGRGRGEWTASEHPDFWQAEVDAVVDEGASALSALWSMAQESADGHRDRLVTDLHAWLLERSRVLLTRLYPHARWASEAPRDA